MLIEVVKYYLGNGVLFQLDNDTHTVAVGFLADIRNALDFFVLDKVSHTLDKIRLVDLIGYFCYDYARSRLVAAGVFLDLAARAYHYAASARLIRLLDTVSAHYKTAGREVGRGNVLHQLFHFDIGLFYHCDNAVYNLAEVVRGNVSRHTDRDTVRPVDEHVREARRQNSGLHARIVERRIEVDGFLVEVAKHFRGKFGKPRFGVSHCRRGVAVDRTEVTVSFNEREIDCKVLRKSDERVVDRAVAVGVVFTETVTDDTRAFSERLV